MFTQVWKRSFHAAQWRIDRSKYRWAVRWAQTKVTLRWLFRRSRRLHGCGVPVIVSLTSYPPRFPTLGLTLKCLLTQSVRPDKVVLWIADADMAQLPVEVSALQSAGLQIRTTRDIGSYKKIIPALREFPGACIVTADDDAYYCADWLRELLEGWTGERDMVVCHRAHVIRYDKLGQLLPYREWRFDVEDRGEITGLFPTSGAGVLYPNGVFSKDVIDEKTFLSICPRADDIWLYWMTSRAGARFKAIGRHRKLICWAGSQEVALFHENIRGGNDVQLMSLIKKYGR